MGNTGNIYEQKFVARLACPVVKGLPGVIRVIRVIHPGNTLYDQKFNAQLTGEVANGPT